MSAGDMTRIRRLERVTKVVPLSNPFSYFSALPNTNPTSTFVLACIDPRFAYALEQYLDQTYAQNGSSYDLFILAGASMGGNLTGNGAPFPNCPIVSATNSWQQTLLDHIQVAITLHNVTQVAIIDHLNCGAYSACAGATQNPGGDQDPALHLTQFGTLQTLIDTTNFYPNSGGAPVTGNSIFTGGISGYYFDGVEADDSTNLRFISDPLSGTPILSEPKGTNSGAKVLVLGCIDPRYSAVMTSFLNDYQGVQFIYDLFILAGASLGANQSYTATFPTPRAVGNRGDYPNNILADGTAGIGNLGRTWGPTFFDHLRVARALHTITEVWVFDHLDCGAYKAILFGDLGVSDDLIEPHITEIAKLQSLINQFTPVDGLNPPYTLSFKGFVIDKAGTIRNVIDDNTGVRITTDVQFGSSRIRNPASSYTDTLAFRRADYIAQAQPLDMTQNRTRVGLSQQNLTTLCPCVTLPNLPRAPTFSSTSNEHLRIL
jgi:carbonic anhydrase